MADDVLFVPYADTLALLTVEDAMAACEEVYRMHARGSIQWSDPPAFKMDTAEGFNNHWHVKAALLKEIPVTGVRLYNYYDDGLRNTVGALDCTRYVVLSDPRTGHALAMVDEHWTYAIRSTAAAIAPLKWMGPLDRSRPLVLGLVGIGTMGTNALRCLLTLYSFKEIRCTSRRPETREAFCRKWSAELGIPVVARDTIEEVVRGADIAVGGTTSTDIMSRAEWLKPGATFVSLARRELDPAGWASLDKVVIDSWTFNMLQKEFRHMVESRQFTRDHLHGEIQDVISGAKPGREREEERILVHTTGLVSQDVMMAHIVHARARERGLGIRLPAAG